MERKNSSTEIEEEIEKNQSNINTLHEINAMLNKTLIFKSKYKQLNAELKTLKEQESQRKAEHDENVHVYLKELEKQSGQLCVEHAKILHQIEHINWHLGHAHPHVLEHSHCFKSCTTTTVLSKPPPPCVHKAAMEHLRVSAERYVKSIAELRRKIFMTKQNVEAELERKKKSEKNMTNVKKEISKQKKLMQMKNIVNSNSNNNNNQSQLPPIANTSAKATK